MFGLTTDMTACDSRMKKEFLENVAKMSPQEKAELLQLWRDRNVVSPDRNDLPA